MDLGITVFCSGSIQFSKKFFTIKLNQNVLWVFSYVLGGIDSKSLNNFRKKLQKI